MKNYVLFLLTTMVLLLTGCSTYTWDAVINKYETFDENRSMRVTPAHEILISQNDIEDRPYIVLADIQVWVFSRTIFGLNPTRGMVNERLQLEAEKLFADAVILVTYGEPGFTMWSYHSIEAKGRAIKFK